jgi:peptidoglycan/xylan/chitin deacetylase (PgdA/CDA1 family)
MISQVTFRFDIDTIKCIEIGVPRLVDLAVRKDIKFLFFINAGKSIHRVYSVLSKKKIGNTDYQLSIYKKLGYKYILKTLVLNRKMYKYDKEITQIVESGQVLGLHGGKNHKTWEKYGSQWTYERVLKEIKWAKKKIEAIVPGIKLKYFSSPAWQTSPIIISVCENLGLFSIYDSRYGKLVESKNKNITIYNTDLCEKDEGVGYIESLMKKGLNDDQIFIAIVEQLKVNVGKITFYDHPLIAGVCGLKILERVIDWCKAHGIEIVVDD